ncbi:hypothetical protein EG68_10707 [Paragonimus skrjabini miyazakii]|uniref:Uncharacterized protein n=1 Tax=Paragonimus skrjabini miyazakii TaxID=59628 RepID=A0A8S9YKN8_9TREM|nr:hypothetical protein EG68_10707 [Paragonimus skrjabini miyazakii]
MLAFFQRILDWIRSLFWREEMDLTLVGLQYSGKTTFVNVIASGQFVEDTIPTVGFNLRRVTKENVTIKVIFYLPLNHFSFGILVVNHGSAVCGSGTVVDPTLLYAADHEKLDASRNELHSLLDKPQLLGIPVLVLGNKKDLPNALAEHELIASLNLGAITDREVCCYSISCKEQENIDITLQWLIKHSKSNR